MNCSFIMYAMILMILEALVSTFAPVSASIIPRDIPGDNHNAVTTKKLRLAHMSPPPDSSGRGMSHTWLVAIIVVLIIFIVFIAALYIFRHWTAFCRLIKRICTLSCCCRRRNSNNLFRSGGQRSSNPNVPFNRADTFSSSASSMTQVGSVYLVQMPSTPGMAWMAPGRPTVGTEEVMLETYQSSRPRLQQ